MKLSIVIPAYNEAKYIGKCLATALQTCRDLKDCEIIVVNNASTDNTAEIVKHYPGVILIEEPRKGANQARQAGLEKSSGELIANIDADTQISPTWLDQALNAFNNDSKLVGLSGPYIYYDSHAVMRFLIKIFYWLAYPIYNTGNKLGKGGAVMGGNVVFKKSALLAAGGYNTDLKFHGDDTDTANRLNKIGKVIFDYQFFVLSSARRFKKHGFFQTGFRYFLNYIWMIVFKKPYHP